MKPSINQLQRRHIIAPPADDARQTAPDSRMGEEVSEPRLQWKAAEKGGTYPDAVIVSRTPRDQPLYFARVRARDEHAVGYLHACEQSASVPDLGQAATHTHYEVLTNPHDIALVWVPCSHGAVPDASVTGGHDSRGDDIHLVRVPFRQLRPPGMLLPHRDAAVFSWNGLEFFSTAYEVLCFSDGIRSRTAPARSPSSGRDVFGTSQRLSVEVATSDANSSDGGLQLAAFPVVQGLVWTMVHDGHAVQEAVAIGKWKGFPDGVINFGRAVGHGDLEYDLLTGGSRGNAYEFSAGEGTTYEVLENRGGIGLEWIRQADGSVSESAVHFGCDSDGSVVFLARIRCKGGVLPAVVVPKLGAAVCFWQGERFTRRKYEVLSLCAWREEVSLSGDFSLCLPDDGESVDGDVEAFEASERSSLLRRRTSSGGAWRHLRTVWESVGLVLPIYLMAVIVLTVIFCWFYFASLLDRPH